MAWIDFTILLSAFLFAVYCYIKRIYNYWPARNVITLPPIVPIGNLVNPISPNRNLFQILAELYDFAKSKGQKHAGFYFLTKIAYVPLNPDILREIFTASFSHFNDRGVVVNEKADPLSANLFGLSGQKWKNLRAKLTPTFTSGKMKNMFLIMSEMAQNMIDYIDGEIIPNNGDMDTKEVMSCYTTDVIGSAAFGLVCNSFKNPQSEFRYHGKRIFRPSKPIQLAGLVAFTMPELATKLNLRIFEPAGTKFFQEIVQKTINYRETNKVVRKDFLQLLIDMKSGEQGLTDNEIAAQAFLFFVAGFETSSTTMMFALYEMAQNFEVQQKARDEVLASLVKHNGELTYDSVMDMKYLQMVIDETLRKYPSLPLLNRKVTEDFQVPESDLLLEKGTTVFVPAYSIHHDSEYFPDPEKFDPERFTDENKQNIRHFTYLPFGEGPRICIGLRFGVLQAKVGLALLLKNYTISMDKRTKIPMEFDPISFVISPKDNIYLKLSKI